MLIVWKEMNINRAFGICKTKIQKALMEGLKEGDSVSTLFMFRCDRGQSWTDVFMCMEGNSKNGLMTF